METKQQPVKQQKIIAMKGHPGTGKTKLARSIALALRCPLIDKDDIRDSTKALEQTLTQLLLHQNNTTHSFDSTPQSLLNSLSYEVIWRMVSTQLSLGLDAVIVDSPLSRRAYLDRLLGLAASASPVAKVVIIHCKPKDEVEWKRRLEQRSGGEGGSWHKPASWEDMERLLEGYGGCWDYDTGEVAKLVVDTTARVEFEELVSSVLEFIASCGPPNAD